MVDGAYIRQWIHMRYKACNFRRYMSESDMSVRLLSLSTTLEPQIRRLLVALLGSACSGSCVHAALDRQRTTIEPTTSMPVAKVISFMLKVLLCCSLPCHEGLCSSLTFATAGAAA